MLVLCTTVYSIAVLVEEGRQSPYTLQRAMAVASFCCWLAVEGWFMGNSNSFHFQWACVPASQHRGGTDQRFSSSL